MERVVKEGSLSLFHTDIGHTIPIGEGLRVILGTFEGFMERTTLDFVGFLGLCFFSQIVKARQGTLEFHEVLGFLL